MQSAPSRSGSPSPELAEAVELAGRLAALGLPRPLEIEVAAPEDPAGFSLRLEGFAPRVVLGRDDLDARLRALARVLEAGAAGGRAEPPRSIFASQTRWCCEGTPSANEAAVATGPHSGAAASGPEASGGRGGSKPGG